MPNTLSSQLVSHQITENYSLSVALMWCRDTAVTPEQCQDKCHTITQHNTPPTVASQSPLLKLSQKKIKLGQMPQPSWI